MLEKLSKFDYHIDGIKKVLGLIGAIYALLIPIIIAFYVITNNQINSHTELLKEYMVNTNNIIADNTKALKANSERLNIISQRTQNSTSFADTLDRLSTVFKENIKTLNRNFKIIKSVLEGSNKIQNKSIINLIEDLHTSINTNFSNINVMLADQNDKINLFTELFVAGLNTQYESYSINIDSIRVALKRSKLDLPFWIIKNAFSDSTKLYAVGISNIHKDDSRTFLNAQNFALYNMKKAIISLVNNEYDDNINKKLTSIKSGKNLERVLTDFIKYKDEYVTKNQYYLLVTLYRKDIPFIVSKL